MPLPFDEALRQHLILDTERNPKSSFTAPPGPRTTPPALGVDRAEESAAARGCRLRGAGTFSPRPDAFSPATALVPVSHRHPSGGNGTVGAAPWEGAGS